ncbi:MAG: UDP-N-acetylenolpyruvoylglucosamine reductase [Candidatus Blackburnbacteria bacterium RIFCSPHIGHO2_01_FULL_44_64]|uniref:UDP-N-acetylenolpyruvoylglucosamine reductase n=1 Tax=Candidatus Blackburnbacteria bacterium RIFCSPHIGHO2_02_FULL_44_20 TaxID=1797516 RepID=A0A1G1V5K5_9BACT|nr:MAG: UDP-N-acetylenolpyruvoylglucosamine reductase [Candidatus Blackburnbacteria bacterium RIFCSPHIGHO2_01_FULL_44_64]OGY10585.1 MAG: UDP-N-acetylenolpyruvoylglucosamine reductase [Candidatus Blackburnbacteria bacterium RIFCSPHIGHO2_12_FULL_44_25]OGY10621.1 MAG: UDP-N-acetylenolpyruvoylglucosamine reductase [Candidatus Blackburnbacteria bacterium RIFCSPHIGHO2_02_FULL_44_20]OGY15360.1 MAG: UDP-N-acetylenolpyruvoylglucosamine reductase [Candidatus Blackburnbacteria bacterium RIFCSPLOWO2_01_FULL
MIKLQHNIPLASFTTLGIGGPARYFIEASSEEELKKAVEKAHELKVVYMILAGGSNLLISDEGYDGMVIKLSLQGIERIEEKTRVKPGTRLQELVDYANENGLGGVEKLIGIPGTVGGAVFGNAGAYGQTISDKITRVRIYNGVIDYWLSQKECNFTYRDSGLKAQSGLIILEAEFNFDKVDSRTLQSTSEELLVKRLQKYPPGIKCPGSFFKNLLAQDLPEEFASKIPVDYYGKMPAGYFLDLAGAKGDRIGNTSVASYHANLFINEGNGKAKDFFGLARKWRDKVKEKFGITLEPEVQLIGFKEEL